MPFLARIKDAILCISIVSIKYGVVRYTMPLKNDGIVYTADRESVIPADDFLKRGLNRYSLVASTRLNAV